MPLGTVPGGASTFDALTDTPANKAGSATKFPKVNAGETGLEFAGGAHLITLLEALSAQKWNQQFNNMLKNGSFEPWSAGAAAAPDGWTLTNGSVAREATIIRFGEYSAKVTRSGTDASLWQNAIDAIDADTNTYWRGRTITAGCWVYATVADRARLRITDAAVASESAFHPGDSTWRFITLTHTLDAAATLLRLQCQVVDGDTDVYFDGAILVEGPICPAFAQHPNDQHLKAIDYQDTTPTNFDYGLLRMECGQCSITGNGTRATFKIVTFGTAFTKILAVVTTPAWSALNSDAESLAANLFVLYLNHIDGANWSDPYTVSWIAIGIA